MPTMTELQMLQALPLKAKILKTQARIREWVYEYGEDGVYISFSGGKDSTVLLDIVRKMYPNVPAVFVDTGLEYPEIRDFVKTKDNVIWIKPKLSFKQVCDKYGYPIFSKQQAQYIYEYRHAKSDNMRKYRTRGGFGSIAKKYLFMLEAPFEITHHCCNVMKKQPCKTYEKETNRKPIIGTMACESYVRTQKWIQQGCNAFDNNRPVSNPMSFWTEQDVYKYIIENNIEICSVYGEIVKVHGNDCGQMSLFDDDLSVTYKASNCDRTGCMFCMFGCTAKDWNNFERIRETHPKIYEYMMKPEENGGLGYKDKIDWINSNGNFNIRY